MLLQPALVRANVLVKLRSSPARTEARGPQSDPPWEDARIAEAVEVSIRTVENVRRRFATRGLKASLVQMPPDRSGRRAFGR
jgi:hypothetical protein